MATTDTATLLANLKAARATGALSVRNGDSSIQYRSLAEIDKIISDLEGELATTRRCRVRYTYQAGKGL